jgi:nucleoside-diphosphate-sugar epimerase
MRPILRELGVEAAVVDVFDADRLRDAMAQLRPSIVVHQLTALPPGLEPSKMAEALVRNTRIRDEGTRNLVSAAIHAGARRLIAQSVAFVYATGTLPLDEQDPLDVDANDGMRGIPECDSIVMGQGPKVLSGHDRDERCSRCMSPGADSGGYP